MPTYEYRCTACGKEWEEVQRISEPPLEVCPACGKPTAHRLISAGTGFILKGGGWYSDLYSSAKPASNKTESNATTSSDSSGSSSGSSKPAAGGSDTKASASPSTPTPAAAE